MSKQCFCAFAKAMARLVQVLLRNLMEDFCHDFGSCRQFEGGHRGQSNSPFGGDLNPVRTFQPRSNRFIVQIVVSERKKAIRSYISFFFLKGATEIIDARKDSEKTESHWASSWLLLHAVEQRHV